MAERTFQTARKKENLCYNHKSKVLSFFPRRLQGLQFVTLQTHHEYSTLKQRGSKRFNVEYTWFVCWEVDLSGCFKAVFDPISVVYF